MTRDQVIAVARRALETRVDDATLPALRAEFRGIHLSVCRDDDVTNAEPFLREPGLNVYLVDARPHCVTLTNDLDAATGLLLAGVDDED